MRRATRRSLIRAMSLRAGFARAALGAGAHPTGASIGGSLGFHWSFQAWHRDTPGDSNLSDAIAVDFTP